MHHTHVSHTSLELCTALRIQAAENDGIALPAPTVAVPPYYCTLDSMYKEVFGHFLPTNFSWLMAVSILANGNVNEESTSPNKTARARLPPTCTKTSTQKQDKRNHTL